MFSIHSILSLSSWPIWIVVLNIWFCQNEEIRNTFSVRQHESYMTLFEIEL